MCEWARAARLFAALATALAVLPAWGAAPQRMCSLSLAGDELLALLAPAGRVVCVSSLADDPLVSNVAGRYPKAIPRLAAQIEPVLATRPDLVIVAPWNQPGFAELLGRAGVAVFTLPEVQSFEDIAAATLALGRRVGESAKARSVVDDMNRRLEVLDRRVAEASARPRVLSFSHLIVAGAGTTVDALIRRAGARNAAAELDVVGHQQVPLERILLADPDWLLLGFDPGEKTETVLDAYPLLKTTRAAREGRVIVMSPRELTTVTPFLVDGAEALAQALHPEVAAAYREASR